MLRLSSAPRVLLSSLLLCSACSDDGGSETGETGETGGALEGPVFFPPGSKLLPAGDVWRGCLDGDGSCDDDETPGGRVHISSFFIDRFEATARSYGECVEDDVCTAPMNSVDCNLSQGRLDHPINCITYDMAQTYCEWRGMRLPTEAEWEYAARGEELLLYPWGDQAPDCMLAHLDECGNSTTPVGSLRDGDSPFGIADMVGNVSEWVSDYYDAGYFGDSPGADNPQGPESGSSRVVKGSAFTVPTTFPANRISKRNSAAPDTVLRIYGVRCARDR